MHGCLSSGHRPVDVCDVWFVVGGLWCVGCGVWFVPGALCVVVCGVWLWLVFCGL